MVMGRKALCLGVLVVLGLILTSTASAKLVGWWKFDETTGTLASDSSGRGNDGASSVDRCGLPGRLMGRYSSTALMITWICLLGRSSARSANSSFTVWTNCSQQGGAWQRVFDIGTGTTVNMFLTPAYNGTNTGNMRFAITTGGSGAESQLNAPSRLPTGWHHLALVFDGAGNMELFLDGTSVAANTTAHSPKDLTVTTQNWLGRSEYSADAYYNGAVDDFRIYDEAVSEKTINKVIMAGLGGANSEVASKPKPGKTSIDVPRDVVLGWQAGPYAKTHDVYFGTVLR